MKKIPKLFPVNYDTGEISETVSSSFEWVHNNSVATIKRDGSPVLIDSNGDMWARYSLYPNTRVNADCVGCLVGMSNKRPFRDGQMKHTVVSYEPKTKMVTLDNNDVLIAKALRITGNFKDSHYPPIPSGLIECQPRDLYTGHHPFWKKCDSNDPLYKYHWIAYNSQRPLDSGTYELIGEKIQGNPEKISGVKLVKHGADILEGLPSLITLSSIREYLRCKDIEGIVFYNKDNSNIMCKVRKEKDCGLNRVTDEPFEATLKYR